MKQIKTILTLTFFVLTLNAISFASDFYVDAVNGDNANSGISADDAWKTITYAFSYVEGTEGDLAVIHVAAGTYNMDLGEDFPIEMISNVNLIGVDRETTIIDAASSGTSVITCIEKESVSIENLTIKGGSGIPVVKEDKTLLLGGGFYCLSSQLKIIHCNILDNNAYSGAGIFLEESDSEITNCLIENNKGSYGGGLYCWGGSPFISDCVIRKNQAIGDDEYIGGGGGIRVHHESTMTIENCEISENFAHGGG
ncbi:DUF1565 domain-containing protein, partial [bacterium]|nr:DUF1565 domain-containing protein [bacterium]